MLVRLISKINKKLVKLSKVDPNGIESENIYLTAIIEEKNSFFLKTMS